jgi:hypothetical protein
MALHHETSLHWHYQSRILRLPVGRLWFLRAILRLKRSLKRIRPSRFSRCRECTKCVCMGFRHLEAPVHRIQQSRFSIRPETRLCDLRAIHLLKTLYKLLRPNRFFEGPECRKWDQMAPWHYRTSFHRHHQRRILRRSEGRLRVVRSIRLLKSWFKRRRLIRFFNAHDAENDLVAFRHVETSLHRLQQCWYLRRSEGRLWVARDMRLLRISLTRLRPIRYFRCPGCR